MNRPVCYGKYVSTGNPWKKQARIHAHGKASVRGEGCDVSMAGWTHLLHSTSSTRTSRERKFHICNAYSLWNGGAKAVPIGDRQASCASQQQSLDLSTWCNFFWTLNPFSFHLMSSHPSFFWKLLAASHCHCSLCHPISSPHLNSSQLIWCLLSFFHFISSNPISCLLSLSQLFSADHNCSHLFSCHLSLSHLISSHLGLSQLFSDFHSSSQPCSALRSSCELISCLLISSLLLSHPRNSSHISSADLSSCPLTSPHLSSSQRTLKSYHLFSGPKPAPKTDLDAKASNPGNPYASHWEDLTQGSFYTQQAFAQRSLDTQELLQLRKLLVTAKLSHTASFHTENLLHTEAFTQQTFTHSKLSHREAFTQSGFYTQKKLYTQKPLHRSFYTQKLLHTANLHTQQAFTQRIFCTQKHSHTTANFYTQQTCTQHAFTQRIFYTQSLFHAANFHTLPAFTQKSSCTQKPLHTASFYTEDLLHRAGEAVIHRKLFAQRSIYIEKLFTHSKLLQTEAFAHSQLSPTANFYTQKPCHRATTLRSFYTKDFTHSKHLNHRENLLANHYRNLDAAIQCVRCPAAKGKSTMHAAVAPSNLDAAITMRSAETQLQSTKELRARTSAKRPMNYQFHWDLQRLSCKTQKKNASRTMLELSVPPRGRSNRDPGTARTIRDVWN